MMIASGDWRVNTEKASSLVLHLLVGSFGASIFSSLRPTFFSFKKLRKKTKVHQEGITGVFIDFWILVSIAVEKPP